MGSEMCIRDRALEALTELLFRQKGPQHVERSVHVAVFGRAEAPVTKLDQKGEQVGVNDVIVDLKRKREMMQFGTTTRLLKGRVWPKNIFCVWLAFAGKIVVARTAELNLAWFTRYEPRKPHNDDITAFSLTQ